MWEVLFVRPPTNNFNPCLGGEQIRHFLPGAIIFAFTRARLSCEALFILKSWVNIAFFFNCLPGVKKHCSVWWASFSLDSSCFKFPSTWFSSCIFGSDGCDFSWLASSLDCNLRREVKGPMVWTSLVLGAGMFWRDIEVGNGRGSWRGQRPQGDVGTSLLKTLTPLAPLPLQTGSLTSLAKCFSINRHSWG